MFFKLNNNQLIGMQKAMFLLFLVLLFSPNKGFAAEMILHEKIDLAHSGYLSSVKEEYQREKKNSVSKNQIIAKAAESKKRILFFEAPKNLAGNEIIKTVFSDKLSAEFSNRYKSIFGQTEGQLKVGESDQGSKYTHYNSSSVGVSGSSINHYVERGTFVGDEQARQSEVQRFGTYMGRRMIEFHIGEYAKDKPMIRKIEEFKKKYSKASVSISRKVKLRAEYKISSNDLKVRIDNPWIKNVIWVEFDDQAIGPKGTETTASLFFQGFANINFETRFKFLEKSFTLVGSKSLSENLSASFNTQFNAGVLDSFGLYKKQELFFASLNWNY